MVRGEVEARALAEDLLCDGAAHSRRLHEAVAAEAAGRVHAVGDRAEDRVRVRRHVVEPGPRVLDRGFRRAGIAVMEARQAVGEERFVHDLFEPPARLRVDHRQHEPLAAAAEVEAGLLLEHHRQALGQVELSRRQQLPNERPHRELDAERLSHLRRPRPAGDHERVGLEGGRVAALPHLHAELGREADELARHSRRVSGAVRLADDGTEHVGGAQALDVRRVDRLDRDAELLLDRPTLMQRRQPLLGPRDEQVADLVEQRRAELLEETDAGLREPHLGCGRELLADSAHRLRGRAAGDAPPVGEDDLAGPQRDEVVRDGGACGPGPGYDDSSHASSSRFSSSRSRRSGARTSSRTGTPRRPRTYFAAAWNGKRSSAARRAPTSPSWSRTSATTRSGKTEPSPETVPTAPRSMPRSTSSSAPTKTSSPSSRYGSTASNGLSETFSPAKFGARSRSCSTTWTGTA